MTNKILPICILALLSIASWQLGSRISPDALGLMLGVLLGIMAGIPAALLALSARETIRHEHVHRIELPKTPQQPTAPIPTLLPQNARIVESDVTVLPSKSQKRIEVRK